MGSWNVVSERIFAQSTDPGAIGAGAIWTDTDANLTYRRNDLNTDWILIGGASTVSDTEYGYLDGVTSAIQTQLNAKQATLTGLTASVAELNYTDGVTSAIQTQLDAKLAKSVIVVGGTATVMSAVAANRFIPLAGNLVIDATEANVKQPISAAGTFKNARVNVTVNASTTNPSLILRKNGASVNIDIQITALTTGTFSNTAETDTVAAADLMNWLQGGTTVGTFTGTGILIEFDVT